MVIKYPTALWLNQNKSRCQIMISKNQEQRSKTLTKQIPALAAIPEKDRLIVFNKAFKSTGYKVFLAFVFTAFVLVFYFNINAILEYKGLQNGGILAKSLHFLEELGTSFFLPLMAVLLILVLGRNYFVKQEVQKYVENQNK